MKIRVAITGACLMLAATGSAVSQRAAPPVRPPPPITVPTIPRIEPIRPLPPPPPPPRWENIEPIRPIEPLRPIQPDIRPAADPRDPCRLPSPPAYCAGSGTPDGGGDDSCSFSERSCSASAGQCLSGYGLGRYYYIAYLNRRPSMFHYSETVGEPYSREMNICWSQLETCLTNSGC